MTRELAASGQLRILLLEDNEPDAYLILHTMKTADPGALIDRAATRRQFTELLASHQRVFELEQLKRDAASVAARERVIIALAEELRETAAALAPDDGTEVGERQETLMALSQARLTTDSAFEQSMTSVAADPSVAGARERASNPERLRALLRRMRDAEDRMVQLARLGKYPEAHRAFFQIESINEDSLAAEFVARFGEEQLELEEVLAPLARGNPFNRLTLGGMCRNRSSPGYANPAQK